MNDRYKLKNKYIGIMFSIAICAVFFLTIGYSRNGYDSSNTEYALRVEFDLAYVTDAVARIGDTLYNTLQSAINHAVTDESQTTIVMLNDSAESVEIPSTKNIVLNLNGKTLSNFDNTNVIINRGVLHLFGGTVSSDAETNGAINNKTTGTIDISGGTIEGQNNMLYQMKKL